MSSYIIEQRSHGFVALFSNEIKKRVINLIVHIEIVQMTDGD